MNLFPRLKGKPLFTKEENARIVAAIGAAEKNTSGEIRVYVEKHCRFVDPLDRAAEIFHTLKMNETAARNAVLLYVAVKDRQFAIFADQGIHHHLGNEFWAEEVRSLTRHFMSEPYVPALEKVIMDLGRALSVKFPYDGNTDRNELPDDIVFGR